MRSHRRLTGIVFPIVAAAGCLVARPAAAAEKHYDFLSPGLLFSIELNRKYSFGLGAELSFNRLFDKDPGPGYGAFTHATYYFDEQFARLALGGQANVLVGGVEAGWAVNTASTEGYAASTGPILGAFGSIAILMVAFRGTIPVAGDSPGPITIDIGLKAPIQVGGATLSFGGSGKPS